jgi:hypothetical protein
VAVVTAAAVTGNLAHTANATDDMEKEIMRTNNMKLDALETFIVKLACGFASTILLLSLLGLLLVVGFPNSSFAQDAQPKTFASPGEASNALFEAAQKEDEQGLEAILGAGKEVTSSSDEVEDKLEREQFCKKYQEMHRLVQEPDGSTVLYIGAENWPFPIPLAAKNGAWYFDSNTGTDEIRFRRVGENEATAIQVCEEFAITKSENHAKAGSQEGAKASSEDPITRFAESLVTAGVMNADSNGSSLFHGYYFRTLTGDAAADNSRSVSGGKKRAGVVLVAYPADYRSTGIETFIVTRGGIVYEKDLGPNTVTAAPGIKTRTSSWHPAD